MLKPEKKWCVGERQFDDYREAQKHAAANQDVDLRHCLINILNDNTTSEGTLVEDAIDQILKHYTVKPRVAKFRLKPNLRS